MHIEWLPLDKITPYDQNPRHNEQAVDAVAASIREFGFRQPIVVDAEGVIICGHTRYKAARKLGLQTIPVHVAKDLSPEQVKAYRLADNKTAELSDWNYDLLSIELGELQNMNVDISLLGFSQEELDKISSLAVPDFKPSTEDEQLRLDQKQPIRCPKCGYEFILT